MALPSFNTAGLLPEGLHRATEAELEDRCVTPFADSSTRSVVFTGFREYRRQLESAGVSASQWIDGSFVDATRLDPADVDVVNFCSSGQINALSEDFRPMALGLLAGGDIVTKRFRTHSFVAMVFPPDHPYASGFEDRRRYWSRLFTTPQHYGAANVKHPAPERGVKGIVSMTVGDPNMVPQAQLLL